MSLIFLPILSNMLQFAYKLEPIIAFKRRNVMKGRFSTRLDVGEVHSGSEITSDARVEN
jgi:hypothetical protein